MRTKALFIWNELETIPESSDELGTLLYHGDVEKFVFSDENMKKMAKFIQEVKKWTQIMMIKIWLPSLPMPLLFDSLPSK